MSSHQTLRHCRAARALTYEACFLLSLLALPAAMGERVISTSPQLTEIMFQLGKGSDVVAASQGSLYPKEAQLLPMLGPLYMPSIELTVKLEPDWVLLDARALNHGYEQALRTHRISELKFDLANIEALVSSARTILKTIYHQDNNPHLAKYTTCLTALSSPARFSYLAVAWPSPIVLFGRNTFLSDVLNRIGGKNAAPLEWSTPFPQVADEWILSQTVEVIFFLNDVPQVEEQMKKLASRWWPKNPPRLEPLNSDYFARASFTPFIHLDDLNATQPKTKFKECLESKK